MTNKDNLQKEILEKVKPGMKPSDIKRGNIKPKKDDEGYSSEEEKNIPKAPPLPNQNLLDQITSLKKQLQTYKDFKEVDLKIKERYKEEIKEKDQQITKYKETISKLETKNQEQYKSIQDLQKQLKSKGDTKETNIETFNFYHCKNSHDLSLLVLELPEGKLCQPC